MTNKSDSQGTIVFIDLAGFTAATATHGDEAAADLAGRLCELTAESLGPNDQLVKGIGDAVMLLSRHPHDALAVAGRICHLADSELAFPLLRMALHHGPVVERSGDWFGATVNIAARISALAEPDQVLATIEVAMAAEAAGMAVTALGPTVLRGTPTPVDLFAVTPCDAVPDRAVDPVCRMAVLQSSAPASRVIEGVEQVFCSAECAVIFDGSPR